MGTKRRAEGGVMGGLWGLHESVEGHAVGESRGEVEGRVAGALWGVSEAVEGEAVEVGAGEDVA